ncbi:RING finger protein 145-like isoform X2 [Sitophilus oryzae]|nr:RING finger protein 145-like isoform X2 [Sitophilus oryzae]
MEILQEIHNVEQYFIKLHNIYGFASQVSFFILCEQLLDNSVHPQLKGDKNVVMALTTVLFYSVLGYFATRVRDICLGNRTRTVPRTPSFMTYTKWICRIILEWIKALIVVLCLREQGIQYEPKLIYSIITFVYYLLTERIFIEVFPKIVEALNIRKLDNLEYLYIPFYMNVLAVLAGLSASMFNLYLNYSPLIFLALYFMVYLRIKDAYYNYWEILVAEKEAYSSFQIATQREIEDWDDICAVCLSNMSRARITPCNHLFHPYCLKQCLRTSFLCPLCKQHFLENMANK